MIAALLVLALNAAPVPAPDLTQLDQPQLLQLHEKVEGDIPARWPGISLIGVGAFGYFPTLLVAIVGLGILPQEGNGARDTLLAAGAMTVLSTALVVAGVVLYKRAARLRDEALAALSEIDEQLDAFEQGGVRPPPVAPAPPLQPTSGALHLVARDAVTAQPLAGATFVVDGRRLTTDASGAVEAEDLQAGTLELVATRDGYREAREYARVVTGRRIEINVRLLAEGKQAPARLSGLVRSAVNGLPAPAKLEVAGRVLSADPRGVFTADLEPGVYAARISAPGFVPQTREVHLREGERIIFNVDLQPQAP